MRLVNLRILGLLGALALLFGFSLLTQAPSAAAAAPSGATVVRAVSADQSTSATTCAVYDSWCEYCSRAPDAVACKDFAPAHDTGGKVSGAKDNADNNFVPGVDIGVSTPGTAGTEPIHHR
jgi:hypothetical protein